ncbi:MAG: YdcF family protein [Candidatus Aenigmatarchaeota archaeon]|nr:MAG: YdcF family protein [Candidatus Aenigmarchaeota archaeon]
MGSKADAIVVLGGGLTSDGGLPKWTVARLEEALKLYTGQYVVVLGGMSVHVPAVLDADKFPVFEAFVEADYLTRRGVDPLRVLKQWASFDTIGEAFFTRVMHTDPLNIRRLIVITSEFHMPRTRELFTWIFGLDGPRPPYELEFVATPNEGMDADILAIRLAKEDKALEEMRPIMKSVRSMEEFHRYLFSRHGAYAVAKKVSRESGDILKTYRSG